MRNVHDVEIGTVAFVGDPFLRTASDRSAARYPTDAEILRMVADSRAARSAYIAKLIGKGCAAIANRVTDWCRSVATQRALAAMDERMLRDIGLDPVSVRRNGLVLQAPWM